LVACDRADTAATEAMGPAPTLNANTPSAPSGMALESGRLATADEVKKLLSMPVNGTPISETPVQTQALAKAAALLPVCTIGWNSSVSLSALPNHASNTFVYSPWYSESCNNLSYWIRTSAINMDHFHLASENPNQCYGNGNNWGIWNVAHQCVGQSDAMYWSRKVMNMNGNSGVVFTGIGPDYKARNFDLKALYVRDGSVQVWAYRVGVGWWYWPNLTAAQRWYWTGNNTNISEVRVFDTNSNGVFGVDNLEVAMYN
jgi:hypothetical protein